MICSIHDNSIVSINMNIEPFRICLVDDEPTIVNWLAKNVSWESYNCEVVSQCYCGQDALSFLQQDKADILITDIRMPDLDGLTLIQNAKNIQNNLRIIVISAYDDFSFAKKAMQLGSENYLLKPLNLEELHETIQKTILEMQKEIQIIKEKDIRVFRNNFLQRWAENEINDNLFPEQAEIAGIQFDSKKFNVISIFSEKSDIEQLLHLYTLFDSIKENWKGYFFADGQNRIIGILPDLFPEDRARLLCVAKDLKNTHPFSVKIVVGPQADTYQNVHISFEISHQYLTAMALLKENILFCDDYPCQKYFPKFADSKIRKLDHAIQENEKEKAYKIADELIWKMGHDISKAEATALAVHIFSTGKKNTLGDIEFPHHAPGFSSRQNVVDFREQIFQLIEESLSGRKNIYHPYVSQTISQLKENYRDMEQNLQSAAERFGISPAYFGQLFHSQTGIYFNDFLTELRMESACVLLSETDLKIGQIAAQSGISSHSYFNRIFRKKYGLSPLEYRYMHHLEND